MRARDFYTQYDVVVSNYKVIPNGGKFIHQFTPRSTDTIYQFESTSKTPQVEEGCHYNIGFTEEKGIRRVDYSSLSKTDAVNPQMSLIAAIQCGKEIYTAEKEKNDARIRHSKKDGYYWIKKNAWRVFGMCIAKEKFYEYLAEIGHPTISCTVDNPPHPPGQSIAYLEDGLEQAMEDLMGTAVKSGRFYKSPKFSSQFSIRGVNAITDKK